MLFKTIKIQAHEQFREHKSNYSLNEYLSDHLHQTLKEAIPKLKNGISYHYDTFQKWSPHELLAYVLDLSGPAEVYIATWAIKQYPASVICKLKESGRITKLTMLLDYRISTMSDDTFAMLEQHCDEIILARSHAKLTVIRNAKWGISIVHTANYTQNTRNEIGVITCDTTIADYRINWIKTINQ